MTIDDLDAELAALRGVVSADRAAAWGQALELEPEELMRSLVPWAAGYADAPISRFRVGAVARGGSGALYAGANLEFPGAALSCSVHAEQAALVNASLHGESEILALATSALPCGYCRQFLGELDGAERLRVLTGAAPAVTLRELLPSAFGPADLGISGGWLNAGITHGLVLERAQNDPLALGALAAANAAYAPYSGTYAGIGLRTRSGAIHTGRYAENAAFNPSLSPLQAALVSLRLAGERTAEIVAAVLVESGGPASQRAATATLLATFGDVALSYLRAVANPDGP